MDYRQATEFLFSQLPAYHRVGKAAYKNNLDNTVALDDYFNHPHRSFSSVHIAGTNGKGSVSHILASVLQEAGYRTGLYTSPHLVDFRERIRVNGEMIPEKEVAEFVEKNEGIIRKIEPSFFEMTVAMAFDFFRKEKIDIAVVEVGLGGRLDSTNIITPVLSVITNIGHDHMDLLGDTLGKIAAEKAGIIKNNIPVVISESHKETIPVFSRKAAETGSEIFFADRNYACTLGNIFENKRRFVITGKRSDERFEGTTVLCGDYQQKNLVGIYQSYTCLRNRLKITEPVLRDGIRNVIRNTGLAGRWQVVGTNPLVICDTGHNLEGLEYVIRQIDLTEKAGLHMIIGFVSDKDISGVLPLFRKDAAYYFTKASVPRALDQDVLALEASKYGLRGSSFADVGSAVAEARRKAGKDDLIFIGGSTFVVADALRYLQT